MIIHLLYLSLILIPVLIDLSLAPFTADIISDPVLTKEILAFIFIFSISFTALFNGIQIRIKNYWVLILISYMILHPLITTHLTFDDGVDNLISQLWTYKPLAYTIIYFLFFMVISSLQFTEDQLKMIVKILCIVGVLTGFYIIIQKLGWDQFQNLGIWSSAKHTTNANLTATFTHPNYAASFLTIVIPLLWFNRWYFWSCFLIGIIFMVNSQIASGALILGFIMFIWSKCSNQGRSILIMLPLIFLICLKLFHVHIEDNGRFEAWRLMWQDLNENHVWLTGHGFGSFHYYFQPIHRHVFTQAHNELWQFIYEGGLIAGGLLIYSIFWLIKRITPLIIADRLVFCLFISFMIYCANSMGQFVTQIEPHRYIGVLLFSILTGLINRGGLDGKQKSIS